MYNQEAIINTLFPNQCFRKSKRRRHQDAYIMNSTLNTDTNPSAVTLSNPESNATDNCYEQPADSALSVGLQPQSQFQTEDIPRGNIEGLLTSLKNMRDEEKSALYSRLVLLSTGCSSANSYANVEPIICAQTALPALSSEESSVRNIIILPQSQLQTNDRLIREARVEVYFTPAVFYLLGRYFIYIQNLFLYFFVENCINDNSS